MGFVFRVLGMHNFAFSGRRLCYRGFIGGTAVGVPKHCCSANCTIVPQKKQLLKLFAL